MREFNLLKQYINRISHSELCCTRNSFDEWARKLSCKKIAFTMAEILLSLTIIGVVAAITLPSLTGNINEKTWETQRKALYNRLTQAIKMLPALNGYGTYAYSTAANGNTSVTADTAAIAFVTEGLSKVLKLNQICDSENLTKCGLPATYTKPYNISVKNNFPKDIATVDWHWSNKSYNPQYYVNTKAAGFITKNGESVALFYNPFCASKDAFFDASGNSEYFKTRKFHYARPYLCANFVYDLNGKRGPNRVGSDIGVITAFYSTDSVVVAPQPNISYLKAGNYPAVTHTAAFNACKAYENNRLANIDELTAVAFNSKFFLYVDNMSGDWHSNTKDVIPGLVDSAHWKVNPATGTRGIFVDSIQTPYLCVKSF